MQPCTAPGCPNPVANRGYSSEHLMGPFMLSLWCGANRFATVLAKVFGYRRMANYKLSHAC